MKPGKMNWIRRSVVILCALILLLLAAELLFRGRVLRHAWASGSYQRGDYQAAERAWKKLREPGDADPIPESSLGKVNFRRGKYGDSARDQADALKQNDKPARFHYDRGNALYRAENLDEALKAFRNAMLRDPDDLDAKSNYELVLNRQGYQPPPPPQEQPEQQPAQPEPRPEEGREHFRNQLDALDQQEARERQAREQDGRGGKADKWW